MLSSATSVIWPAGVTRRMTGMASVPLPRETAMYTFLEVGIDHDVVDRDLVGGGPQHRRDLLVDSLHFETAA